jgi:hypothetical protein
MARVSKNRIRFWAAVGSLTVPMAVGLAASVSHAGHGQLMVPSRHAGMTPCPTGLRSDGNENRGCGDIGNENKGDFDNGNGNTADYQDGNANSTPGATPCPSPTPGDDFDTDC